MNESCLNYVRLTRSENDRVNSSIGAPEAQIISVDIASLRSTSDKLNNGNENYFSNTSSDTADQYK